MPTYIVSWHSVFLQGTRKRGKDVLFEKTIRKDDFSRIINR